MASSPSAPTTLQTNQQQHHRNGLHHNSGRNDDGENVPIAGGNRMRMMRRFGTMLMGGGADDIDDGGDRGHGGGGDGGSSADAALGGASRLNAPSATGYVEFGMSDPERSTRTLGTFAGVFSPVALSMFSALLFIRVGFLVGNAGFYVTLLQFMIAYLILVFTVMSVCAISTNGAVEGGGVYFMISRTLGAEFGGSIGTLFFLANLVGAALAITGCVEGIVQNFGPGSQLAAIPDGWWWRFLYCSVVNTLMLLIGLVGADMFAKTNVVVLGIVSVCMITTYVSFLTRGPMQVAIPIDNQLVQPNGTANGTAVTVYGNYTGFSLATFRENLFPHYGPDYTVHDATAAAVPVNFAIVFGVLFSGVTGIMAGANMSGELRRPSHSIPVGTLSAVAFTFCVYLLLATCMAATTSNFLLRNNFQVLMPVSWVPDAVAVGTLTATFSTAMSNLIGASRVLEALAKDQMFGRWLNWVRWGTWRGNPMAAVAASWVLVELVLLVGSLNLIAQVVSVLFLLAYFAVNLACLGIECTGAPNFRPTFAWFTWHTCVLGLCGTLIMMFVINPVYASLAIILCLVLVMGMHLFSPTSQSAQWGSISQALMFHQVRKYLLMLDPRKDHVKFWRPQILLLVASPRSCCPLIDFVNDLKKGGLYVLGHVKCGDFAECGGGEDPTQVEYGDWMALIEHMRVKAFAELTMAPTIREGVQHLIRISGMGAMKPNTIVVGFHDDEVQRDFFDSENSPYQTLAFGPPQLRRFAMRHQQSPDTGDASPSAQLTSAEYVAIVCDVLRMKKNLCLCRHFHRLDKQAVLRNVHVRHLDVWPVNVFEPSAADPFDVVSLFMMQLACIINMLPAWKRLHLRVFLCEPEAADNCGGSGSTFSVDSVGNGSQLQQQQQQQQSAEHRLRELLKMLRISASIHQVPEWSHLDEPRRHDSALPHFTSRTSGQTATAEAMAADLGAERVQRSREYMQRANEIIRNRSNATAATFIYLPAPPRLDSPHWAQTSAHYLELLTALTDELPPTVLVHGISPVTSINL